MVDAVISYWVTLVVGKEEVPDGFGQAVKWLAAFFYADDGLLYSPRLAWLQAALDILIGFFYKVVLQTNVN